MRFIHPLHYTGVEIRMACVTSNLSYNRGSDQR